MSDAKRISQLEEALFVAAMALAEVAKWRRLHNRMFIEDHAIRATHILIDGKPLDSSFTRHEASAVRTRGRNSIARSRLSAMTPEQVRAWPAEADGTKPS